MYELLQSAQKHDQFVMKSNHRYDKNLAKRTPEIMEKKVNLGEKSEQIKALETSIKEQKTELSQAMEMKATRKNSDPITMDEIENSHQEIADASIDLKEHLDSIKKEVAIKMVSKLKNTAKYLAAGKTEALKELAEIESHLDGKITEDDFKTLNSIKVGVMMNCPDVVKNAMESGEIFGVNSETLDALEGKSTYAEPTIQIKNTQEKENDELSAVPYKLATKMLSKIKHNSKYLETGKEEVLQTLLDIESRLESGITVEDFKTLNNTKKDIMLTCPDVVKNAMESGEIFGINPDILDLILEQDGALIPEVNTIESGDVIAINSNSEHDERIKSEVIENISDVVSSVQEDEDLNFISKLKSKASNISGKVSSFFQDKRELLKEKLSKFTSKNEEITSEIPDSVISNTDPDIDDLGEIVILDITHDVEVEKIISDENSNVVAIKPVNKDKPVTEDEISLTIESSR